MKFIKSAAAMAACAAALILAAPLAHAGPDDPIQGTEVGLEGDPGSIVVGQAETDARGAVGFGDLAPGRYVVFLPDASRLKVPVSLVLISGTLRMASAPILPGKAGKAYALGKDGRRLLVTVERAGGRIMVNASEAAGR